MMAATPIISEGGRVFSGFSGAPLQIIRAACVDSTRQNLKGSPAAMRGLDRVFIGNIPDSLPSGIPSVST